MEKKSVTLLVGIRLYNKFRKKCKEQNKGLSKQFENFMKKELSGKLLTKSSTIQLEKRIVTFVVDSTLYKKYRDMCDQKGLIASRRFEIYMENNL